MCGRLNVIDNPVMSIVYEILGIDFNAITNTNLSPSQRVATVGWQNDQPHQLDLDWGIKPPWSKKLIINAQAETVAEKKTFKKSFVQYRCLVPCSGWYEWRDEGGSRKQKYLFERDNGHALFMAGIWFNKDQPQLVTLTTAPNKLCAKYHHRMPLLIDADAALCWLSGEVENVVDLLLSPETANDLVVKKVK